MKKFFIVSISILLFSGISKAQTYDFSAIDTLINDNLATAFRGGVVCLINKDGQPIYSKEAGDLVKTSTGMIASATKTFSAVLILALCDQGIISLDDSVGKFLPSFTQEGKNKFTLRQCFSHTAGYDFDDPNKYLNSRGLTLQQAADSIAKNYNFAYEPGTAFYYTGIAMQIAGAMAEKAAGARWVDLFKTYVADKCSLTATRYTETDNPRIAGGINSSAVDMMKLAAMILNKGVYNGTRVVSEAMLDEMWKDQTHHLHQLSSPYPYASEWNNPYSADTIYYGIGDWLDVYNPTTHYQEQISGDGAFGALLWVDRCRGITGAFYTQSLGARTIPIQHQIIDVVRNTVGSGCFVTPTQGKASNGRAKTTLHISPNPFNPETIIRYEVAENSPVELTVYNTNGRLIERLVKARQSAGSHQVVWQPKPSHNNVYFISLKQNNRRMVKKVFYIN